MVYAIGIDIGGTKILGGLVDEYGKVFAEVREPSPAQDPTLMLETVVSMVRRLQSDAGQSQVVAAGVAGAGFIDAQQSTVLYSPNLNWRNEPLREKLDSQLQIPVVIENDANAAGWAEFKFGAGRDVKDMIMLTLGTGVGGAVVADGKLRRGGFGIAGELGHVRVVQDGRLCGCGVRGCVEQYASGTAVLEAARELANSDSAEGARLRALQGDEGDLSGLHVYQAVLEGDRAAIGLLETAGDYLGQAIGTIVAVLDPQLVVIGGGLSETNELILRPIRESYLRNLPARGYRPELEIRVAEFSNQAGVIGAADLAREAVIEGREE